MKIPEFKQNGDRNNESIVEVIIENEADAEWIKNVKKDWVPWWYMVRGDKCNNHGKL